jgi:hypothetical protein
MQLMRARALGLLLWVPIFVSCASGRWGSGDEDGDASGPGGDGGVDAAPGDCSTPCDPPPPPVCVDPMTSRSYGAGTCDAGVCAYPPTDTPCALGCEAGACRFDPAACPVGDLDGCCGLVQHGGSDPDCPSLDCDLQIGAPVAFADVALPATYQRGGVGLAWTGDRLITARIDDHATLAGTYRYILEYRDGTGAVLSTQEHECPSSACGNAVGPVKLAHEATSDRFLLSHPAVGGRQGTPPNDTPPPPPLPPPPPSPPPRYVILDADGAPLWARDFGVNCIASRAASGAFTRRGELVAVWDNDSCGISGPRGPAMQRIAPDGTLGFAAAPTQGAAYATAFACDTGCDQVGWFYANSSWELQAAAHDLTTYQTQAIALSTSMYGGMSFSAMAWNGTSYFVVNHEWPSAQTGPRLRAQQLDPTSGWLGSPVFHDAAENQWQHPTVIWTGSGYVMAIPTLTRLDCNGGTECRSERRIEILQFRADGTLRRRFQLEHQNQGALVPNLAWAGGRIALTWVGAPQQGPERRFLAFLECAP